MIMNNENKKLSQTKKKKKQNIKDMKLILDKIKLQKK